MVKQLEAVAIDSVYCLSQSGTWCYKLAENHVFRCRDLHILLYNKIGS